MGTAANPWAVVSVAAPNAATVNATTPPASSAASSSDPWAVAHVGEQPAAATPPAASSGLGEWVDKSLSNPGGPAADEVAWGIARGGVKSAGRGLGTILDMISRPAMDPGFEMTYRRQHPQATHEEADQAYKQQYAQTFGGRMSAHLQDAASWLKSGSEPDGFWEHVGEIGEQTLEYIGSDGLLKMAGGGVKAAVAVSKAAGLGDELKNAQQVAATLKNNPKLAGLVSIGLKASKDAALMGAQTYVHTEDPAQAGIAAAFGGGVSAATGGASAWLNRNAVKNLSIAGEKIPALASQVNEAGLPQDTGALGAPEVAQAQQRGAQNVIRNTAAQATATALDRINQTRPVFTATEDASRMLPAPEGSQPFTFSLEGTGGESRAGRGIQEAEPIPRTHTSLPANRTAENVETGRIGTEPEYIQPGGEGGAWAQRTGRSWVERRTPGYMHPGGDVEGAADVSTASNLQTTDPAEAQSWLRQLDDLQASPEFAQKPEAQQQAIRDRAQALNEQLGIYHASPYGQRFDPLDVAGAAGSVRTFGDAADQIEAAAKPVYSTLDRVSGGEFNKWKEAAKQARGVMQRSTTVDSYETALNRLNEANRAVDDIIDSNRGAVNSNDYITAKNAWRQSARLDELHGVFERMMNGVTVEESEQGLGRVMTGRAKDLERYLAKDTNRTQLEQLIGKEGLFNLKQITLLLTRANTSRATHDVLRNTWTALAPHVGRAGAGALIGYTAASAVGANPWHGAAAGALTADGLRYVLRTAATSPRIGNMVEYAARNGLSPQHYAPLIARAIAEPFENTEGGNDGTEQPSAHPAQ